MIKCIDCTCVLQKIDLQHLTNTLAVVPFLWHREMFRFGFNELILIISPAQCTEEQCAFCKAQTKIM